MFQCSPHDSTKKSSILYVIAVISNPCRYSSRYHLYNQFAKMVSDSNAVLITVETAFGNRPFAVTSPNNISHVQLRTSHELWHKENMINLGIQRLPEDWEYVAWIDADVMFARPDWVNETLNQLQHYDIVQMFSKAHDLDPNCDPFQQHIGFVYSYMNKINNSKDYSNWHPGFAWAARRKAIDDLGGLIDFAILGAADRHMAHALIGKVEQTIHKSLTENYKKSLILWQDRANKYIKKNIGFVPGLLLHHWHGKKRDRRYAERWSILVDNHYDPAIDLKRDWQGLWQLTDNNLKLRDELRGYFRARDEDSIDLNPSDRRM